MRFLALLFPLVISLAAPTLATAAEAFPAIVDLTESKSDDSKDKGKDEKKESKDKDKPSSLAAEAVRRRAVSIEGCETFTEQQIRDALFDADDLLVLAATIPGTKDVDVERIIADRVIAGYRHVGFPLTTVRAVTFSAEPSLHLIVREGPQYMRGDVAIGIDTGEHEESIRRFVAGESPSCDQQVRSAGFKWENEGEDSIKLTIAERWKTAGAGKPLWTVGAPGAAIDRHCEDHITSEVGKLLAIAGEWFAKATARIDLDHASGTASLTIDVVATKPLHVSEIIWSGLLCHTPSEVLRHLGVNPLAVADLKALSSLCAKLRASGRFLEPTFRIRRLDGQKQIILEVQEIPGLPMLGEPLTELQLAMLRHGQWMNAWKSRDEDVVFTIGDQTRWVEVVATRSGEIATVYWTATDKRRDWQIAALSEGDQVALWSKVNGTHSVGLVPVSMLSCEEYSVEVKNGVVDASMRWNWALSASSGERTPSVGDVDLSPAGCLAMSVDTVHQATMTDGRVRMKYKSGDIEFDAATGRLLPAAPVEGPTLSLRFESGRHRQVSDQIAKDTTGIALGECTVESLITALTDLGPLLATDEATLTSLQTYALSSIGAIAAMYEAAVDQAAPENPFSIPGDAPMTGTLGANPMSHLWCVGASFVNRSFAPTSWPVAVAAVVSRDFRTSDELHVNEWLTAAMFSKTFGPLGWALVTDRFGKKNPEFGKASAEMGKAYLSLHKFRVEYDVFVNTDTPAGRFVLSMAAILRQRDAEYWQANLEPLVPDWLRDSVRLMGEYLRANRATPIEQALPTALDQVFEVELRGAIERVLARYEKT